MKKIYILLAVVAIIVAIFLPKLLRTNNENLPPKGAPGTMPPQTVNAIIINYRTLEDIIVSNGSTKGNEEVELRAELSGKITKIFFKEGGSVRNGELLVKINDAELKAQLLKSELRKKLAEDKEYRLKQLLQKEGASREQYDIALNELNSAIADIEYYKALIEKTEIRAPFNGIAGLRSVSEGSYITPANIIAAIQAINPIKIDFSVPQKYYSMVKVGNIVRFKIPNTEDAFNAKIYAIEPRIDPETRTIQIRAISQNDKGRLMPGAFIRVELVLQEIQSATLIPTEALLPDIEGEKVFLYKSGFAVEQLVKTGIRTEKEIQIAEGLKPGDTVITSGIIQLKNKMPVKIAKLNN